LCDALFNAVHIPVWETGRLPTMAQVCGLISKCKSLFLSIMVGIIGALDRA
jgi:hypothetical protein